MSENQKFRLGSIGSLTLSVVSSVFIVVRIKAPIKISALLDSRLLCEHKPLDARAVIGFGLPGGTSISLLSDGISIGLLNLSLGFNSISFHQMAKLAIVLAMCFGRHRSL